MDCDRVRAHAQAHRPAAALPRAEALRRPRWRVQGHRPALDVLGRNRPFGPLADQEPIIDALVHQAASRMDAPLVCVDAGQLIDGRWRIIEIGDPQYSAICHMSRHFFWQQLIDYAATL
jgi:hypothetical protein